MSTKVYLDTSRQAMSSWNGVNPHCSQRGKFAYLTEFYLYPPIDIFNTLPCHSQTYIEVDKIESPNKHIFGCGHIRQYLPYSTSHYVTHALFTACVVPSSPSFSLWLLLFTVASKQNAKELFIDSESKRVVICFTGKICALHKLPSGVRDNSNVCELMPGN